MMFPANPVPKMKINTEPEVWPLLIMASLLLIKCISITGRISQFHPAILVLDGETLSITVGGGARKRLVTALRLITW